MTMFTRSTQVPQTDHVKTVAFDYAAISSVPDLEFYSKFDLLVTGGILAPDQSRVVRSGKTRLVLYLWSSAIYPGDATAAERVWEEKLRKNSKSWLIRPDPVTGGAAAAGRGALWYDFANSELASALAEYMHGLVGQNEYAGIFLDTLGFQSLANELQAEFRNRHPNADYDQCQGEFISKLRKVLGPQAIIFTNQAYRKPEFFLPHSDFDLIENSATFINSDQTTGFRPWLQRGNEWESIEVPMTQLVMPASRSFPRTEIVHINYARGDKSTCEHAVSYSFACAKLWNHISFVSPPDLQTAIPSNVYFQDLGTPLTPSYEEDRDAGVAWRRFQNGVVALNSSDKPYRISSLGLDLTDPPRGYIFQKAGM
jgi:hypothetical protein